MSLNKRQFLLGASAMGAGAALSGCTTAQIEALCDYKVRHNVNLLVGQTPTSPFLQAYIDGVAAMKAASAADPVDPTGWLYQANIHGIGPGSPSTPSGAPWATCNHGLQFLAWHRMYLYFFERIVRAKSGYSAFTLPYWNYSAPEPAVIPAPFRDPSSTLFDPTRRASLNAGGAMAATAVGLGALGQTAYVGGFQNQVNGTPHGAVHVQVSGNMGAFATAGRDPLFWLHHCNIDRLQEAWLAQGGRNLPLGDPAWRDTPFTFAKEDGALVTMTAGETVWIALQLNYVYDDPRWGAPDNFCAEHRKREFFVERVRQINLQQFRADGQKRNQNISLDGGVVEVPIEIGPRLEALVEGSAGAHEYVLVLDGIRTPAPLDVYYEIYLGARGPADLTLESPYYVGNLDYFGRSDAEMRAMKGDASAMRNMFSVYELTDAQARMAAAGSTSLTFVAVGDGRGVDGAQKMREGARPTIGEAYIAAAPSEGLKQ